MKKPRNIPTDEEFERASHLMAESMRGLDELHSEFMKRFGESSQIRQFFILDQEDVDFRVYVFFERNDDVAAARNSGLDCEMTDFVYSELERLGRESRNAIDIAFGFDSDENVQAHYEGDYFLRLR